MSACRSKHVLASARVPGPFPTLRHERKCWEAGDRVVVGIDEVGRGSWAGPVTVGAVVAPEAAVLSVRGNVRENGMNRFFRRRAEGVYDMEDLARRTWS